MLLVNVSLKLSTCLSFAHSTYSAILLQIWANVLKDIGHSQIALKSNNKSFRDVHKNYISVEICFYMSMMDEY